MNPADLRIVAAMSRGDAALKYAALGWNVFPLWWPVQSEDGSWKCACKEGAACGRIGKHPLTKTGNKEATTDADQIRRWWTKDRDANIGVATGQESNLLVIDADCSDGKPGVRLLTERAPRDKGLLGLPIVNTGSGGIHLFCRWTDKLKTGADVVDEAIDVRSTGGYVVLPPSLHASGRHYEWRGGEIAQLIELPEWLATPKQRAAARRGRKRTRPGFPLDKIESMLRVLDASDRTLWLNVATIMGRLYVGTPDEQDAYAIYGAWAARSPKADEDRAGNDERQREAFFETSQQEPRAGGKPLTVATIIAAAKAAGWSPFGDRLPVLYEPGNELHMAQQMVEAIVQSGENKHFNVMGEVRDVLRTKRPNVRHLRAAHDGASKAPETLIVRRTTTVGMLGAMMGRCALQVTDRNGAPTAAPIPHLLAALALESLSESFPPLAGVAEWPMVGLTGELIAGHGYDASTGLYFDIDSNLRINEEMTAADGWRALSEDLLCDFPFENQLHRAGALALMLAFMQRPLMRTCPAFAVVAPQPNSGKSTLVEVASIAVHGAPVSAHAWTRDNEELRKALHALLMMKIPAILFDNLGQGSTVDSDHLAKLLTSEEVSDRKLGASETRKETNSLLITFTGNNIAFVKDLSTRVITLQMNANAEDPLSRPFKHADIYDHALRDRARWLSALIAIARAGIREQLSGARSRFADFDAMIARSVHAVTGQDVRTLLAAKNEADGEDDATKRALLDLIFKWQRGWRKEHNGQPWTSGELVKALDEKLFDEQCEAIFARACGGAKAWERDRARALGYTLRALNGSYRLAPLRIRSKVGRLGNEWEVFNDQPEHATGAAGGF